MLVEKTRSFLWHLGTEMQKVPHTSHIQDFFFKSSHSLILHRLKKDCRSTLDSYLKKNDVCMSKKNSAEKKYIWVCWWQGLDSAPYLVKECIQRIENNCNDSTLIILTEENYSDFISFPSNIQDAIDSEKVSLNHITDLLRVYLLAKYGGIWIDSTVFTVETFDESILQKSLMTIPIPPEDRNNKYVSQGRWSGFFIGCNSENRVFFQFIADCMKEYFIHNSQILTYFFLDYLLEIAYENNIYNFRRHIDQLGIPDFNLYELNDLLVANPQGEVTLYVRFPGSFYKLNWKSKYAENFEQITKRLRIIQTDGGIRTDEK